MRGIDGEHVHFSRHQLLRTLEEIAGGADGRAHAQAALAVLGRVGILQLLLDVLDGDQALEIELVVYHQKFLHAVLVEDGFGLLESSAHGDRDQILLGHHFGDGKVEAVLEAQIAIGENADEFPLFGDRNARDPIALHQGLRSGDGGFRADGDGVDDHAAFTAFDAVDFFGLAGDRQVAVDDSNAALLRQSDREVRLGDGIHGGRNDRNIQSDLAGKAGSGIDFRRQHIAEGRFEQYIIEGEAFGQYVLNHRVILS